MRRFGRLRRQFVMGRSVKEDLVVGNLWIALGALFTPPESCWSYGDSPEKLLELSRVWFLGRGVQIEFMLTDETLAQFLTSHPARSYSLLIFFGAVQLHDKPELHVQSLRSDFALVANSFIYNNNPNNKLFFCDIEFKHSQSSFSLFYVNSHPHICLVAPHHQTPKHSHPMDQAHFSRLLDSLPDFIQSHTDLSVGHIDCPPAISTRQLILIFLLALISAPFLVKKVLEGDTLLHEPLLWMTLSMFVYFFSVSGAMRNIIRKMPMFMVNRNDPSRLVNQAPSLVPLSKSPSNWSPFPAQNQSPPSLVLPSKNPYLEASMECIH
ncbi:hypothetical protein Sjap_010252 [Stephania japonica]|uniref:Uncharacterized protein n=1 Tax=Stephania japonica TaxID=461633 RepID=A0AAP0JAV2_9MAGN